jgi:hypothetical protein
VCSTDLVHARQRAGEPRISVGGARRGGLELFAQPRDDDLIVKSSSDDNGRRRRAEAGRWWRLVGH